MVLSETRNEKRASRCTNDRASMGENGRDHFLVDGGEMKVDLGDVIDYLNALMDMAHSIDRGGTKGEDGKKIHCCAAPHCCCF